MVNVRDFVGGEVLLIDKPYQWTSFDVVNKIKYAFKPLKLKIGHAGTLDPLATGLLVICTGKKTKEIELYQGQEKEYTGKFLLGETTPSFDLETEVDARYPTEHITGEAIEKARKAFIGVTEQIPPVFSAIKVDGKRAYQSARQGKEVELKARRIEISEFDIDTKYFPLVSFRIVCSKGTYIRSIARDFGLALGTGAYLAELRRTRIGLFDVKEAMKIEEAVDLIRNNNANL